MPQPPHNSLYLGIDLGGTNIHGGILNAQGRLTVRDTLKTKAHKGADAVVGRIDKLIGRLLEQADLKTDDITAIGVGAPGAIDTTHGVVIEAVNLRWNDFPLAKKLSDALGRPVIVDNDVNVGAWGEFLAGAGAAAGERDMLGIFVGTGIGGGLILDGKLYYGAHQTAGEIGHMIVHLGGGLGRRTVENLASRTAIANLLAQLIQSNRPSLLTDLTDGDLSKIRSRVLAQAMERGDALTRKVIEDAARELAAAIAGAVTLLSLPCVVVGGGLTQALGKTWVDLIRKNFEEFVFPPALKACKIVESQLGDDAGVVGAALLARDHHKA